MIVDLANSALLHLRLDIDFEADRDNVTEVAETIGFSHQHEGHYSETAMFRRAGQIYQVVAHLYADAEPNPAMSLHYQPRETGAMSKARRASLSKIGSFLNDLAVPCSVSCVAWGTVPRDRYKPIIDIPVMRFHMPQLPFDELRGIRLVKLGEGGEQHSVALDIHTEDQIHVYLNTKLTATSHSKLPSDALARLVELKNQAVVEVQPDA